MLRKHLKFGYHKEMYALKFQFICTILLIVSYLRLNEAVNTARGRRRFGQTKAKLAANDNNDKTTTDQTVAATTNNAAKKYRRDGTYSTPAAEDYIYNTADFNLIQPENKNSHSGTKIRTKYSSSITIPYNALEDTETAEEYVAKAVGMYGARFREPIHVSYEPETTPAQELKYEQQPQKQEEKVNFPQDYEQKKYQKANPQAHKTEQRITEEQKQINNEYYTFYQKDVRHDAYLAEKEPKQAQTFYKYSSSRPAVGNEQQGSAEKQDQRQEQEYKERERPQPEQSKAEKAQQNYENEYEKEYEKAYEKEPATRSYQIYEDQTENYEPKQQIVNEENKYRNEFIYQPVQQYQESVKEPTEQNEGGSENLNEKEEDEERIRVSASTEIPKAEIMKQIEQSVIKYMKELEAEGKIVTTTQNQEPEEYFKVETITPASKKRKTNQATKYSSSSGERQQENSNNNKENKKYSQSHNQKPDQENYYPAPNQAVDAVLTPNVEFIYKIKTQAPLHSATVKTVSKPYNLALKSFEQFDHSKALKNLQEFDLTHVVTTPSTEASSPNGKHNQLYFNSEIYHDINAKTLKQKPRKETEYQPEYESYAATKSQGDFYAEPPAKNLKQKPRKETEYQPEYESYAATKSQGDFYAEPPAKNLKQKPRKETEYQPEYETYAASKSQGGYYAEPPSEREVASTNISEDGYPLMNPYQFTNKKEAQPKRPEDSFTNYDPQPQSQSQSKKPNYTPLDYDSYNPKFNNNPEGYGYQQTYKTHLSNRHAPGKRGKRGSHKKSSQRVTFTDLEANIALRPPPKQ